MEEQNNPLVDFPINFPLRVIGLDEDDFESFVIGIVRRHVPDLLEENIVSHFSKQNKYRSVSLEFIAESREQVDALYAELGTHPRILMIL